MSPLPRVTSRRAILLGASIALVATRAGLAQEVSRIYRLGFVVQPAKQKLGAIFDELRKQGFSEGGKLSWAPGKHGVPDLAYRFDFGGRSVVSSGDTAPTDPVRVLAEGVSLLLHDATWSETIDQATSDDHSSCRHP